MNIHHNVFHAKPRIFVETVTGCRNYNCTSPCEALNLPVSLMPIDICDSVVNYFTETEIEVYLYGRGDCSIYPYEQLTSELGGCILNLTADYPHEIKRLKNMGITVYLRCDTIEDLNNDIWHNADGVFMVVGKSNHGYLEIAEKVMGKGKPFMIRSLCNKPDNLPIEVEILLSEFAEVGFLPNDTYISELPEPGCNVTTLKYDSELKMSCCILHDEIYRVKSLDSIAKMLLSKYNRPGWKPCAWCGHNAIHRGNYRLYFNPEGVEND